MRKTYQYARQHAKDIQRIVEAHKFAQPAFVDDSDPEFDLTLLVTPVNRPTLRDMGAIMNDFERELGVRVQLVTPDVLGDADQRLVRPLETI
jgi:predicted nucleotidyltransferase